MDPLAFYVFFMFTIGFKFAAAAWVYQDGKDRDENLVFWITFIFLTLVLGLLFWFVFRRRTRPEEEAYQYWYGPQAQQALQFYQPIRRCIDCHQIITTPGYRCEKCQDKLFSNKIIKIFKNPLSIPNILFILIVSQIVGGFLAFSTIFILIISPNLESVLSDPDAMIELVLSPLSILITVIYSTGAMIVFTYFRAIRPQKQPRLSLTDLGWTTEPGLKILTKWTLIGLGMLILVWAFEIFLIPESDENTVLFSPGNFYEYIILIIGTAIIVPIGEEFFFRGYAFKAVEKNWNMYGAYAFSSLLFAVMHFTIIGLFPLFMIALAFAYILKRSKSLVPCIILHGVNNFLAITLIYLYN
jgi:membrane protease YdiL (CAAX protease family)